ncbi:RNA recognition domain-containing protein [Diaporthe helianthi]|uniref:RNA recognition domain-containing protein n=1 Tax=Diaporthe helianthi TaxID=158607 RepID=A0A2P5HTN2_DIAHE|nr:RNA recognition domain-containing protein [Diaporthe helianthi]
MSTKTPSRVVFVGNIPYGLSEEQISELFSSAGQVLNFRLVYDRDTGRPKGFGFAEYPDADSAASAVRNLNDHEIMGRKLRVDFSNEGGAGGDDSGRNNDRDNTNNNNNNGNNNYNQPPPNGNDNQSTAGALPPLPAGRELPPGVSCTDAISRTLNTLPPAQLLDILSSVKQLATTDPARATELLNQAPQLSYAVFQALLLMGLVSPEAINAVLEPGANPAAASAPPGAVSGYPPPPVQQQQQQQPIGFPGVGATNTPPVAAPTLFAPPAVPAAAPAPAPVPAAGGAFGGPAAGQNPDDLIQQVLSLPDEVIAQLPEAEKQTILQLRAQYSGQR